MTAERSRKAVAVRFVGVTKTYPTCLTAIAELDPDIMPAESLPLPGPSGSGKTTALNLLAGFQSPTSGQILVDDRDTGALPPHRRDIGMVFQHYGLSPHITAREIDAGRIQQIGTANALYGEPVSQFAAQFLGESNCLAGEADHAGDRSRVATPAGRLVGVTIAATRLRLIKSAQEVALLREASRIGCDWMNVMFAATAPGRIEGEIVGEGLCWLAASGGFAHDVAVASGLFGHRYRHRQALPTWDSRRPVEAGEMIHFDAWGPVAQGYCCDLTRSTVVGRAPSASQARVLEDLIVFVESVIAEIAPGRPLSDLHAAGSPCDGAARRG